MKKQQVVVFRTDLLDDEVFVKPNWRYFYEYCVMRAAQEETYDSISVGRGKSTKKIFVGQLLYGRTQFARYLNIPPGTVRNIAKQLHDRGVIILEVDTHFSIITIPQFRERHMLESYTGQAMDSKKSVVISKKESIRIEKDFNDKFWPIYPKNQRGVKAGKGESLKAWKILKPTPEIVTEIIEGLKKYAAHWEAEAKKKKDIFVADPVRFIKKERWKDEYHKTKSKGKHDDFDGKGGSSYLSDAGKVGSASWLEGKGDKKNDRFS